MKKSLDWHQQTIDRERMALQIEQNQLDIRREALKHRESQLDDARRIGITEYDERTFHGIADKRP